MQMNMNRREFLAAFGTVAAGAVLAGCGNSNATSTDSSSDAKSDEKKGMTLIEDGKLTVGMDTSYAPAEFLAEDGKTPVGFDVDIAKAVQAALQKLMDDGTYVKILKHWGVENGAIDKAEINPTDLG